MLTKILKYALLFLAAIPVIALGQQRQTVRGIIFKKGMLEKIAEAQVTNLNTGVISKSNFYGEFITQAAIGDSIIIEKTGYTPFKQTITSYSPLYITLSPPITLNQVNITGQTKKQELNDVVNTYRSKGLYYDGKPSVLGAIFSPLTAMHELFGSDAKNERRFMKYAKREQEDAEVMRRYTPQLVSKTTGLEGVELQHFMENYTPEHDDIVKWNDYQIIVYIKNSYETYKKVGYQPPVDIFKSNP
ncbi:hypothetical protein [Mucilaginibacter ginkgonis]|uniref:Carboxypeptidase-like protein n=1 Tax=Mucilaginibacter ginkgonis TaxID=2682091 RepID=A0A6I4I072_9SPHI|nr:hypothetical protein [Mucilaginibacter ginkgonis]QQL48863.1 hypothetical protein GO620_011805 [Mucilaginibacter ginkgonis]